MRVSMDPLADGPPLSKEETRPGPLTQGGWWYALVLMPLWPYAPVPQLALRLWNP